MFLASPFKQLRFHSNPESQRPRKSPPDPRMVSTDLLLCALAARLHRTGIHLNGRSSHPQGDHRSPPPDYQSHRTGNIIKRLSPVITLVRAANPKIKYGTGMRGEKDPEGNAAAPPLRTAWSALWMLWNG